MFKQGDIIQDKYGTRKILVAIDNCYLVSSTDNFDETGEWITGYELDNVGYKLKESAPWKPEKTERYFLIADDYENGAISVECDTWANLKEDNYRFKTNNVFRTKEEAEARLKEILN